MATAARAPLSSIGVSVRIVQVSAISDLDPRPEIIRRAQELYQQRGCEEGHALDDWLKAESEILCKVAVQIYETPETILIGATVLGFYADELQVCVEPHIVTIAGKKRLDLQEGNKPTFVDWAPERIFARVAIGGAVVPERSNATLSGGHLEISLVRATSDWEDGALRC